MFELQRNSSNFKVSIADILSGKGHVIALNRLLMSALALILSTFDDDKIGFYIEFDDILSLMYFVFAILYLFLSLSMWHLDLTSSRISICVDILFFFFAKFAFDSSMPGYAALGIVSGALIMVASYLRWNQKVFLRNVGILNILCWISCLVPLGRHGHSIDSQAVWQIAIFAFVSVILVVASNDRDGRQIPDMDVDSSLDLNATMRSALNVAMKATRADRGIICWAKPDGSNCITEIADLLEKNGAVSTRIGRCVTPPDGFKDCQFDLRRQIAVEWQDDGQPKVSRLGDGECKWFGEIADGTGLRLAINGLAGSGGLILSSIRFPDWSDLSLGRRVAAKVAKTLDRQSHLTLFQEYSLLEQRRSIARDLHDSIAQSLAGATFWLQSLASKLPAKGAVRQDVERIKSALSAEHGNLLHMIAALKRDSKRDFSTSLVDELTALCELLELHWRCRILIGHAGESAVVPSGLGHEIQQIVREAVANAVKHGQASTDRIGTVFLASFVNISIENDGVGFAEGAPVPRSIAERVASCHGSLLVDAQSDKTILRISLPLGA